MGITLAQRYELLTEVSEGPVSTLHRARVHGDAGFSRRVAVRSVRPELAGDRRFIGAWAATVAQLAEAPSVHVEQVFDVVVEEEHAYVVSEWIEGASLRRLLEHFGEKGEGLPWSTAAVIAAQLLRGLSGGHARQPEIRHDALSLDAVRVAHDGTVKITRFGMASGLSAMGWSLRRCEELDLRHPAPEIVGGGSADRDTDQFGVGTILYTLLAGESPFDAPVGTERDMLATA